MFTVVEIDGVDPLSAQVFAPDCAWPLTDWTRKCAPDEVLAAMPMRMGYFPAGMKAPMAIDYQYTIDTTGLGTDNCRSPRVKYSHTTCEMEAPGMKEISLETDPMNVMDLTSDYCRRRQILRNQLCIFDQNGNFAAGQPFSMDFATWAMDITYQAWAELISHSALLGDDANLNQFDGLYTQLSGGWSQSASSANPCPNGYNTEQVINWATLTGNAGPTTPDAVTIAGQSITLWGQNVPIPAGMNLAQFLERFWFSVVGYRWTDARGGVTQWEAHARYGFTRCLAELAACMQPCGHDCSPSVIADPDLRARFANAVNSNIVKFYPSGRVLPILETHRMPANTLRIGPRSVGGRPTYMLFWDRISRYFEVLRGEDYGGGYGQPARSAILDAENTRLNFENEAVRWNFTRTSDKCLYGSILGVMGMIVCSRHLWLRIDNVTCGDEAFFPICLPNITVDGNPLA